MNTTAITGNTNSAGPREAATFITLPTETRQRILSTVVGGFCPFSRAKAQQLATLPRDPHTRAAHMYHGYRGRHYTNRERRAYFKLQKLYHINRTLREDMEWVEHLWLVRRTATLNLAEFAAFAKNPTPINGTLTLSLFDTAFMANLPVEFQEAVRSLADEAKRAQSLACKDYMRQWREAALALPEDGAKALRIDSIEIVEMGVTFLDHQTGELRERGWLLIPALYRLLVTIMARLGLGATRGRVAWPDSGRRDSGFLVVADVI